MSANIGILNETGKKMVLNLLLVTYIMLKRLFFFVFFC